MKLLPQTREIVDPSKSGRGIGRSGRGSGQGREAVGSKVGEVGTDEAGLETLVPTEVEEK